uniref:hypothetical protein n=1 Tax=Salmonella enterica TaxID=28901 RepID=UPI00155DCA56|nr:hypothetical protein [Salmonella enterica]
MRTLLNKDRFVPAPNNYGVAGSPNSAIAHPDGLDCYGRVPEINSKGDVIPAGDIFLRVGRRYWPVTGALVFAISGLSHEQELVKLGYATVNDVARFVRDIIRRGVPIYCEFNSTSGKHRPAVLKSSVGIVILEPREAPETESGWIYVVVTAYTRRTAHGTLVGHIDKKIGR